MTKTFFISGFIVDDESSSTSFEDVRPSQIKSFIENLEPEDEIEITINSFGGSVSAGLAICNLLKEASKNHKITTHVLGFACSTASFIACSVDELRIDSTAFLMIHNPYTLIEGNANDLRKEALVLDKMKESIVEIYRSKFKLDENEISQWMDAETWIKGNEASEIINCEVIPTEKEKEEEPLEIVIDKNKNRFLNRIHSLPDNVKFIDEKPTVEEPKEEKPVDDEKPVDEEKTITINECEKRISGIQSALQKQINKLEADYSAKIESLSNEVKEKEEKLVDAEKQLSLSNSALDTSNRKLEETLSVLAEKEKALDTLNSNTNQIPVEEKIDWRNLKGQQFFDFLKEHPEIIKNN